MKLQRGYWKWSRVAGIPLLSDHVPVSKGTAISDVILFQLLALCRFHRLDIHPERYQSNVHLEYLKDAA